MSAEPQLENANLALAPATEVTLPPTVARAEAARAWLLLAGGGMMLTSIIFFFQMFLSGITIITTMVEERWPGLYQPLRGWLDPAWNVPHHGDATDVGPMLAFGTTLLAMCLFYAAALLYAHRWDAAAFATSEVTPRAANRPLPLILATTALLCIPLWLAPGMLSHDVYSYTAYGQMAQLHDTNPMIYGPDTVITAPLISLVTWQKETSVYGPLWVDLSRGLTILAQAIDPNPDTNLGLYVLLYKLLAIVAHLLNAALIYAILRRWRPQQRTFGTLLYAWNPLMLIEFANSGHNDIVLLTFILAAILLHLQGRPRWAVVAFTFGTLVKLSVLFVFGPYVLLLLWQARDWRTRVATLASVGGVALALAALLYAPYWAGLQTFDALRNGPAVNRMINSPAQMVYLRILYLLAGNHQEPTVFTTTDAYIQMQMEQAGRGVITTDYYSIVRHLPITPTDPLYTLVKLGCAALMLIALVWNLGRIRDFASFLRSSSWILFFYLCFGALWFWPWYMVLLIGLAALREIDALTILSVVFSCTCLYIYLVYPWVHASIFWMSDYRAAIVFGPPLIIALVWYWPQLPPRWPFRRRTVASEAGG